jgi:hypothetical protein
MIGSGHRQPAPLTQGLWGAAGTRTSTNSSTNNLGILIITHSIIIPSSIQITSSTGQEVDGVRMKMQGRTPTGGSQNPPEDTMKTDMKTLHNTMDPHTLKVTRRAARTITAITITILTEDNITVREGCWSNTSLLTLPVQSNMMSSSPSCLAMTRGSWDLRR